MFNTAFPNLEAVFKVLFLDPFQVVVFLIRNLTSHSRGKCFIADILVSSNSVSKKDYEQKRHLPLDAGAFFLP